MDENILSNYDLPSEKANKKMIFFIIIIIILTITTILFLILFIFAKTNQKESSKKDINKTLSLWNEGIPKQKLMEFMKNITTPEKISFVKNEDRIAVFDLDGTLFQETDPAYLDYKLFHYRIKKDKDYIDKASEFEKQVADNVERYMNGTKIDGLDISHGEASAIAFGKMTLEQYEAYIKNYLNQPADGYNNMKRGDAFYKPMLELIEYLQSNNFTVFVVSGTERFIVRAIVDGHINIPKHNVIGSEFKITAINQKETPGFEYTYKKDDYLILHGEFLLKNLYMNKVHNIIKEIGKIPILSFGNSNGDASMANFVLSNKKNSGLAFMLLCDDEEREKGNQEKANKMKDLCQENGWIPISMKNDWTTIYGKDVTRKK